MSKFFKITLSLMIIFTCLTSAGCSTQAPSESIPSYSPSLTAVPSSPSAAATENPVASVSVSVKPSPSEALPSVEPLPTPSPLPTSTSTPSPSVKPSATVKPSPTNNPPIQTPYPTSPDEILAQMTLEEKVGQMFMPRCPDTNAVSSINTYSPAGYILYQRDFDSKTPAQVKQTIKSYQDASDIPMLISVDEEGGTVVRVSRYTAFRSEKFKAPGELYEEGGLALLKSDTQEKSQLLLSLGINLNLAPVCDVSTNPDDFIYKRSMRLSAADTATAISAIVSTMEAEGIGSALKHFPGYGNNVDTHTGIAIDERPYSTFETEDFLPFIAGINAGAPSILVSHNIVKCMDEEYPASLSKKVVGVLRNTLGFNGVIMTDDLSMGAIKQYTNGVSPAVMAVLAGNDLLLTSDWAQDYSALLAAVKNGDVAESQIDASVLRILKWKEHLGLI